MYDIVFMGTPHFAVPALEALVADAAGRFRVILACTRPDAVSGRGTARVPSPVHVAAKRLGVPVATPISKAELAVLPELAACDFIVVSAYGMVLSHEILAAPRCEVINIHASLLPRWRGAAPIQRALLAGDEQLGVSIMRVVYELDAGAVCAQAAIAVGEKDAPTLADELSRTGARLLADTLPQIASGQARWMEQDSALITYADKVAKVELHLDPALSAAQNIRRVRASTPQAPARCVICGRAVTVLEVQAVEQDGGAEQMEREGTESGQVRTEEGHLLLTAADGIFELVTLKPDGKQAMSARAFSTGLRGAFGTWAALAPQQTPNLRESPGTRKTP
ncbi:MAG: methionyl-tRNA formyltransferase [Coriobacteriales bacterium]|jgi:methionyl-tRNA formyltransferase|nr:methionyl-tRNA formyltransferase [Coriobacteriales bacterium]